MRGAQPAANDHDGLPGEGQRLQQTPREGMDNGRACGWVDRIINMPQRFRDDRGVGCANGKNDVLRTDGQLVAGYFYAVRAIFQVLHPLGRTRDKGVRKRLGELVAKIVEKFSSRKFEQSRPHHVVQILDCLSRQVDIVQLVLPPFFHANSVMAALL